VLPEVFLDTTLPQALNAQLVQGLRQAIAGGVLRPGAKLPPSREAALQLSVGRNTVVDAYAQLVAEGLLETRGRGGSYVAQPLLAQKKVNLVRTQGAADPMRLLVTQRLQLCALEASSPTMDWRLGQACVQLLPLKVWRAANKEAGRHLPPSDYGDPSGLLALRQSIADWLSKERGVHYSAQQIVVTQGAGSAIDLLAALLLKPGDVCAVETPGYPRAAAAMRRAGAQLREVAVDAQGMRISEAFAGKAPVLLHLTPSHQYPLGGRLSGARRRELAQLVMKHGSLLIENEYDHEFIHDGQNHAPLAASLPGHAVLVSTFAKAISPSLRLGFVAAPLAIAQALAQKIEQERLHVSWPVQCAVQWLLQSGQLQKHLRRVRRYYAQLRSELLLQIAQECPQLRVSGQEGGLHVVLRSNKPAHQTDTLQMMKNLSQQGVIFNNLRDFGGEQDALLLAYGQMTPATVKQTCRLLKMALTV
jgi:GntR family transcriptional regulator / MocR family aminotransferase